MISLVDVNVIVALLHERHPHTDVANAWLDVQERGSIAICRIVQMGALRIMTRPSIMKTFVLSPKQFWHAWDLLMQDDCCFFDSEPDDIELHWRGISSNLPDGTCAETDTYLSAHAIARKYQVVTFDKGFERFKQLPKIILSI